MPRRGQLLNESAGPGLRVLAERKGLRLGTCVSALPLENDPEYARVLADEFSVVTPENALKFGVLSRSRGQYDFSHADALVHFAENRGMQVRGHALLWYAQLPEWLVNGKPTRSELVEILVSHVRRVVGRYAGRIAGWDVVNEAVAPDGSLRDNIWLRTIGPEYLEMAFAAARAADPGAQLFYNDYGIEATDQHMDAVYELLRELRRRQVPVDGVGLQMHLTLDHLSAIHKLPALLKRFAGLGLQLALTEFDVRMKVAGEPTPAQLADQATAYREVLRACMAEPGCTTLVMWGFTDRHSWVPHFFPNEGAALLFDEEYRRKPSYGALAEELARE